MTLYISGWRRPEVPPVSLQKTPVRLSLMLLFAGFTIYLVPGVTNTRWADRTLISGFPPPLSYSIYANRTSANQSWQPLHNDYARAIQLSREQNKPILIDFTGWACVNCRRMEEKVWTDARVRRLMQEELISRHSNKTVAEVTADVERDKILTASEAVEYGLIDQVLESRKAKPQA